MEVEEGLLLTWDGTGRGLSWGWKRTHALRRSG